MGMADAGAYVMTAKPKAGQTLDEAKEIMLEQVAKLRNGEFTEDFIKAVTANLKLQQQNALTDNSARADYYVDAFVNGVDWADEVESLNSLDKVTKADVVAVANKYLGPDNYVAIYKRQGQDPNELKLAKPPAYPNRDEPRQGIAVPDRHPELEGGTDRACIPRLRPRPHTPQSQERRRSAVCTQQDQRHLHPGICIRKPGSEVDSLLNYAPELMSFVRTPDMTAEQIKNEFYKLACNYRFKIGAKRSYAVISGLSENMDKAAALFEKVLANAEIPAEALTAFADRLDKARADRKHNQSANFGMLSQYVIFGANNSSTNSMTPEQIRNTNPAKFVEALRQLNKYEQTVVYWGKAPAKKVVRL